MIRDYLERALRRDIKRLIIELPPRHGKTAHSSILFPAWVLGVAPREKFILTSYGADLAQINSRASQRLVSSDAYPWPNIRVNPTERAAAHWSTNMGGVVHAAGTDGPLPGFGASILLIDDPIKGTERSSPARREAVWEWYSTAARTRLTPDGVVIICMTRWHEDDLVGRALKRAEPGEWTVLRLPVFAEADDPLGRKMGAPLWPSWYNRGNLPSVAKGEISSINFSALYQQSPVQAGGNLVKKHWFTRYDPNHLASLGLKPTITTVDSAFKDGVANDFSSAGTWGKFQGGIYLMDRWHKQVQFPELIDALKYIHSRWHVPLAIEDKASGQSAIQVLRRTQIPVHAHRDPPRLSKIARFEGVTQYIEAGMVYVPEGSEYDDYIEELTRFPNGEHDDDVDMTSMALSRLMNADERAGPVEVVYNRETVRAGNAPRPKGAWRQAQLDTRAKQADEYYAHLEEAARVLREGPGRLRVKVIWWGGTDAMTATYEVRDPATGSIERVTRDISQEVAEAADRRCRLELVLVEFEEAEALRLEGEDDEVEYEI